MNLNARIVQCYNVAAAIRDNPQLRMRKRRIRDLQGRSYFEAESVFKDQLEGFEIQALTDLDIASDYLNRWIGHRRFARHFPKCVRLPEVRTRVRASKKVRHQIDQPIHLNPGATLYDLIHQFSHYLVYSSSGLGKDPMDTPAHGWEFCATMIYLVGQIYGPTRREQLKRIFRSHKVRFHRPRSPRQLSAEERKRIGQRLLAGRTN